LLTSTKPHSNNLVGVAEYFYVNSYICPPQEKVMYYPDQALEPKGGGGNKCNSDKYKLEREVGMAIQQSLFPSLSNFEKQ
jgi:hypothetical protein